jgi:hypothetical protein
MFTVWTPILLSNFYNVQHLLVYYMAYGLLINIIHLPDWVKYVIILIIQIIQFRSTVTCIYGGAESWTELKYAPIQQHQHLPKQKQIQLVKLQGGG